MNIILKLLLSLLLTPAMLYSQSEAYNALKIFEPLLGEWMSKHKSLGVFEGEPNNKEIISSYTYEWVTDKTAILETWTSLTAKDNKRIHIGSILYTLDPSTSTIKTKHYGYDGKVYWTGKGWVESKDSTIYTYVEELTINGTKTNYVNIKTLTNNLTFNNQYTNFSQNGKLLKDQPIQKMIRVDILPKKD